VGLQLAIKGFFSGFRRGMQTSRTRTEGRIPSSQHSAPAGDRIPQAEFRSWLEPGKTIQQGLSSKIEAERIRREMEARQEYERQREREAERAELLWPLKALGVLFALAFMVGLGVLIFWALLSAIRWLWEHPLW